MATAQERINAVAAGKNIPPKVPPVTPVNLDALSAALDGRLKSHWLGEQNGLQASGIANPSLTMFKNASAITAKFPGEAIQDIGVGFHFNSRGLIGCTISYFPTASKVVRVLGSMSADGNFAHVASAVLYANVGACIAALTADVAALESLAADVIEAGRADL